MVLAGEAVSYERGAPVAPDPSCTPRPLPHVLRVLPNIKCSFGKSQFSNKSVNLSFILVIVRSVLVIVKNILVIVKNRSTARGHGGAQAPSGSEEGSYSRLIDFCII